MFLTRVLNIRNHMHTHKLFGFETPSYDRYWKKRRTFQQTAHAPFICRNTKLAERWFCKSLTHQTYWRRIRKLQNRELWDTRLDGACQELNYNVFHMRDALARAGVYLDRKILTNIAISEPRTFRAVTEIAATKSMGPVEEGGLALGKCGPGIDVFTKL